MPGCSFRTVAPVLVSTGAQPPLYELSLSRHWMGGLRALICSVAAGVNGF